MRMRSTTRSLRRRSLGLQELAITGKGAIWGSRRFYLERLPSTGSLKSQLPKKERCKPACPAANRSARRHRATLQQSAKLTFLERLQPHAPAFEDDGRNHLSVNMSTKFSRTVASANLVESSFSAWDVRNLSEMLRYA
ncbi:MAG: hypothetical protein AUH13_12955 [Acidobacteria bacterium 13_2_20CM_58_27]|nr:MAG: hypothetical protein AUH13_12955 [Acidobacteria bacterium 13_2_20CM_58_27]